MQFQKSKLRLKIPLVLAQKTFKHVNAKLNMIFERSAVKNVFERSKLLEINARMLLL